MTLAEFLDSLQTTWPARMVQGAVQGAMAPGNAFASSWGNPVTTEQMIAPAANLAGLAVGFPGGAGGLGSGMRRFVPVRGPQESTAGYVYHATNADRAMEIANSGSLKLHKPSDFTDQSVWPDGSTQPRNYFTPTAQNTWQFAPEEGSPVLLRVKASGHQFKRESTGDIYSTKPVPASNIEALTDGGWVPLSSLKSER